MSGWEMDRQKRGEIETWLRHIIWCIPLPFLMDLKIGFDFHILGPAYYLAMIRQRKRRIPAVLLGTVGVLLLPGSALRWKYGMLLSFFLLVEWYLERYRPLWSEWKRCIFNEACLAIVVLIMSITGMLPEYQMVMIFLEGAFLLGASCLYQRTLTGQPPQDELTMAGVSLTLGTILAAFHWLQAGSLIPAEAALLALALISSYGWGIGKGLVLTLPAGFFMRLTMTAGEGLLILSLLTVLLAGAFRDLGKRACAAAGFSGGCLWILLFMGGSSVMPGIMTMGAACLAFGMLPEKVYQIIQRKERETCDGSQAWKRYLENQLSQGSQAFAQLAALITAPPRQYRITSQDLAYLKEDIAGSLCQDCKNQKLCWGKQYARTHETVIRVMEATNQKGKVEWDDLPKEFIQVCVKPKEFVRVVNRRYELYRLNQSWENRMGQSVQLLQSQYEAMSRYLEEMRSHFAGELVAEEQMQKRILKESRRRGIDARAISVVADEREDRIWVYLEVEKLLKEPEIRQYEEMLTQLSGRQMELLEKSSRSKRVCRYRFSDPNLYRLHLGAVSCGREAVSGDSYTAQRLDAQRFVVALGDGMGSGEEAHRESTRALALLEQLLLTGIEEEKAIRLLNTALVLTSREEAFTTIDLALINLHTGQLKLVKAGSCTTFLRSRCAVYVYHSQSLPVGIIEEPEPETFCHAIESGDLLLMISDGVLDQLPDPKQGERWIRRYLMQTEEENPKVLAQDLQEKLAPHLPKVADDQTILAVRIEKRVGI